VLGDVDGVPGAVIEDVVGVVEGATDAVLGIDGPVQGRRVAEAVQGEQVVQGN
jgi:hypothetical protein